MVRTAIADQTAGRRLPQSLECCSPRRIYDFLFVAPTVGVASTFLKGPVDTRDTRMLDVTAHRHNKNFKARFAKAHICMGVKPIRGCICTR
jgi:hypothetical protein